MSKRFANVEIVTGLSFFQYAPTELLRRHSCPVCVFANRPWYEDGCFNGRLDQLEIELNGIGLDFDVPAGHCQKFTFQLTPAGRAEKGDSASEEKL